MIRMNSFLEEFYSISLHFYHYMLNLVYREFRGDGMLNDLHIHTTYSDGAFTPDEIIAMARKRNIKVISITDHDTLGAYGHFKDDFDDISIIPGVEVSTYYLGRELHILSYFHDPFDQNLLSLLENSRETA